MKNRIFEILVGIVVIIITITFVVYFIKVVAISNSSTYVVNAKFSNVGSLSEGSKVSINGVKVGKVIDIKINPDTYLITVSMSIDNNIKIAKDSKVKIQAASFFETPNIVIIPVNDKNYITNNDFLWDVENFVSIEDKIGEMFIGN